VLNYKTNPLLNKKCLCIGYYELVIFLFLLFEFIALGSANIMNQWGKTHYLLTYEFGFGPRLLVGSIVSLFTDSVTNSLVVIIATVSFIFLIMLISLLLGGIIRRSEPEIKPALIMITILFLTSPFSVKYLLGLHFSRLDIYWIIITLIALVFIKKPVLQWSVPVLCAVAVLVHQAYTVTYMPALAIPLLYEVYKNNNSKKSIAIFVLSCLAMIIPFIALYCFPANIPFDNAVDYAKYLSKSSDFLAYPPMLYDEYFSPFREYWFEFIIPVIKTFALPVGLAFLSLSAPLLCIFFYIWKNSYKHTENKFLKFIFFLCAVAPLAFIPSALFGMDWDRWWAAVINNQFIIVFYLLYSKEKAVLFWAKKAGDYFEKHFLVFLLIIIMANTFTLSGITTRMFSLVKDPAALVKFIENYYNSKGLL
jgi:hypothetical protein